jgi:hypothetical protein
MVGVRERKGGLVVYSSADRTVGDRRSKQPRAQRQVLEVPLFPANASLLNIHSHFNSPYHLSKVSSLPLL